MKTYEEIVQRYRKRQHDTVVDTLSAAVNWADDLAVESGLLEKTGLLTEVTTAVCGAVPFAAIAASEGLKMLVGKKPGKTAVKDGVFRMAKTGAALGVGTLVGGAAGVLAAIPAAMGVRALMDRYKSRALTDLRVRERTSRLSELNQQLRQGEEAPDALPERDAIASTATIV